MTEYHVRQFDGGAVLCDGRNCACASGAMAVAFGSSGKQTPTADEFRTRSGKSCIPGVHSPSGGLFTVDVANTAATYGVAVHYGSTRRSHAQLVEWCKVNGSVVLGDYDQLPLNLRVQDRFLGDHSVWVHDFRDDTFCWHDPLDTKPQRVRSAIVSRYNQKLGSPTKGLQGWTVVPIAPPDTGTGEDMGLRFQLIAHATGVATVQGDGHSLIRVHDGSHAPVPAGQKREVYAKVRLRDPLDAYAGNRRDGYLIGEVWPPTEQNFEAAFVLASDVTYKEE